MRISRLCITLTIVTSVFLFFGSNSLEGQELTGDTDEKEVTSLAAGGPPVPPAAPNCAFAYMGEMAGVHYYDSSYCPDNGTYDFGWRSNHCQVPLPWCSGSDCACVVYQVVNTPSPDPVSTKSALSDYERFAQKMLTRLQEITDRRGTDRFDAAQALIPIVETLQTNMEGEPLESQKVYFDEFGSDNKDNLRKSLVLRTPASSTNSDYHLSAWGLVPSLTARIAYTRDKEGKDKFKDKSTGSGMRKIKDIKYHSKRHVLYVYDPLTLATHYYRVKDIETDGKDSSGDPVIYRIGQEVDIAVTPFRIHAQEASLVQPGKWHQVIAFEGNTYLVSSYTAWPE